MGEIYRNAALVIAAAGSKDSTGGLFLMERQQQTKIQLPYIMNGEVNGTFNIALLPGDNYDPISGPLIMRAWAFQEWYLAKRLLVFMPGGLSWHCRKSHIEEQGHRFARNLAEQDRWLVLLEQYSAKALTYTSDRLYALRGIISEMQKVRKDEFLFEFGVWADKVYEQILWMKAGPDVEADISGLPSWTWAATGGQKLWCLQGCEETSRCIPTEYKIAGTGSLDIAGNTIEPGLTFRNIPDRLIRKFSSTKTSSTRSAYFEWFILSGYVPGSMLFDEHQRMMLWDDSSNNVLGFAIFDGELVSAKCFFVASTTKRLPTLDGEDVVVESHESNEESGSQRSDRDSIASLIDIRPIGSSDSENSISGIEAEITWVERRRKAREEGIEAYDSYLRWVHENDKSSSSRADKCNEDIIAQCETQLDEASYVYWALLLQPVGEAKYKRVGLALLYPHAYEHSSKEFSRFEIV